MLFFGQKPDLLCPNISYVGVTPSFNVTFDVTFRRVFSKFAISGNPNTALTDGNSADARPTWPIWAGTTKQDLIFDQDPTYGVTPAHVAVYNPNLATRYAYVYLHRMRSQTNAL